MFEESGKLLSDEIYTHLLEKIQNEVWKTGDKIPSESQICKEYGVSRVSVRSAIHKLQAQKLLVTKPGKGSFVVANRLAQNFAALACDKMNLTETEYQYIIEFRKALEFTSIDLLCEKGSAEDIERIKNALDEMCAAKFDMEKYVSADFEFHYSIIKGSHNPLFESAFCIYKKEFMNYLTEMAKKTEDFFDNALQNHIRVFNFLLEFDSVGAKKVIEQTFKTNFIRFKDRFKS